MSLVLYEFDHADAYPVLATYTTARHPLSTNVAVEGEEVGIEIRYKRHVDDPTRVNIVLGLPIRGVGGTPQRIEVDIAGDLAGCGVYLEGMEAGGATLFYELVGDAAASRCTWSAEIENPHDIPRHDKGRGTPRVRSPLQFHRLGITMGSDRPTRGVQLWRLRLIGDVYRCPVEIADGNHEAPRA